jgi:hypothetical protein
MVSTIERVQAFLRAHEIDDASGSFLLVLYPKGFDPHMTGSIDITYIPQDSSCKIDYNGTVAATMTFKDTCACLAENTLHQPLAHLFGKAIGPAAQPQVTAPYLADFADQLAYWEEHGSLNTGRFPIKVEPPSEKKVQDEKPRRRRHGRDRALPAKKK